MDDGVSSIVVQVRWPGGEWSRSYGQRGPDGGGPAQPQDRFSVGSVTKSMVAAAVLQLVDDGLIGLDDPVNGLLESFSTTLKPPGAITVRQLLNHTSGMPDLVGALDETGTPKGVVTTTVSLDSAQEVVRVCFAGLDISNIEPDQQLIDGLVAKHNEVAHGENSMIALEYWAEVSEKTRNLLDCVRSDIENAAAMGSYRR